MPKKRATSSAEVAPLSTNCGSAHSTCSAKVIAACSFARAMARFSMRRSSGSVPAIGCSSHDDAKTTPQASASNRSLVRNTRRKAAASVGRTCGNWTHVGEPRRAAEFLQRAVADGDGSVVDLCHRCGALSVGRVAKEHTRRFAFQQDRDGTAVVQVKVQQQRPQGFADGGRVSHQVSDLTEGLEAKALADQQAEVPASGQVRADRQQVGEVLERDAALRIPEQPQIYSGARRTRGGVRPRVPSAHRGWP